MGKIIYFIILFSLLSCSPKYLFYPLDKKIIEQSKKEHLEFKQATEKLLKVIKNNEANEIYDFLDEGLLCRPNLRGKGSIPIDSIDLDDYQKYNFNEAHFVFLLPSDKKFKYIFADRYGFFQTFPPVIYINCPLTDSLHWTEKGLIYLHEGKHFYDFRNIFFQSKNPFKILKAYKKYKLENENEVRIFEDSIRDNLPDSIMLEIIKFKEHQ